MRATSLFLFKSTPPPRSLKHIYFFRSIFALEQTTMISPHLLRCSYHSSHLSVSHSNSARSIVTLQCSTSAVGPLIWMPCTPDAIGFWFSKTSSPSTWINHLILCEYDVQIAQSSDGVAITSPWLIKEVLFIPPFDRCERVYQIMLSWNHLSVNRLCWWVGCDFKVVHRRLLRSSNYKFIHDPKYEPNCHPHRFLHSGRAWRQMKVFYKRLGSVEAGDLKIKAVALAQAEIRVTSL